MGGSILGQDTDSSQVDRGEGFQVVNPLSASTVLLIFKFNCALSE
jgi:hypothetical protein